MDIGDWNVQEWTLAFAVLGVLMSALAVALNVVTARRDKELHDVEWDAKVMTHSELWIRNLGSDDAKNVRISCTSDIPPVQESFVLEERVKGKKQLKLEMPRLKALRARVKEKIDSGTAEPSLQFQAKMRASMVCVVSWRTDRGAPRKQVIRSEFAVLNDD